MKETGKVIGLENDNIVIEMIPQEEACTKCSICDTSGKRQITIRTKIHNLKIGDLVEVELGTESLLEVYLLLYGIPLTVFVAALLILYVIFRSPIISFFSAIILVVITYIIVGFFIKKSPRFYPTILTKKT